MTFKINFYKFFIISSMLLCFSSNSYAAQRYVSANVAKEILTKIFEELAIKGQTDEVTKDLEDFVETYPKLAISDEAYYQLAEIYVKKKDYANSVKPYQNIISNFPSSNYFYKAQYGLGYSQYRNGHIKESKTILKSLKDNEFSPVLLKVKSKILLNTLAAYSSFQEDTTGNLAVAALLPLSGPYGKFGNKALNGVLLASEVFGSGYGPLEVKIEDVSKDRKIVEANIAALSKDKTVKGFIGPLSSTNAKRISAIAQKRKIPIVLMSQKTELAKKGNYIYSNFLTPHEQIDKLAEFSVNEKNIKTFSILYPKNKYGISIAKRFKKKVIELGATVVATQYYKPEQKDFSIEIKKLFGIKTQESKVGRRKVKDYTIGREAEALFIPDTYETIGQISPYIALYNLKDVQLLGTNGWNFEELIHLAGEHVENAIFVDGFFANSTRLWTKDFVDRFKEAYGYTPSVIEAHAYDSTMLMITALTQSKNKTRKSLQKSLNKIEKYEGVTGTITLNPYGQAQKDLYVLTVRDGKIVEFPREELIKEETDTNEEEEVTEETVTESAPQTEKPETTEDASADSSTETPANTNNDDEILVIE